MLNTQPDSPWGQLVTYLREMCFNGMEITANPEKHPEEMRSFATYLKNYYIN